MKKITPREKRAAESGGALDDRIPEEELRERLRMERHEFDLDEILPEVARRVAWLRLHGSMPRMEPAEVRQQARDTIEVIDDLAARLQHLHPDLECWANDILVRARGEFATNLADRITPDLYRIRAALTAAADKVETRRGRKPSEWERARNAIADALGRYSRPVLAEKDRKPLAGELLEHCGLPDQRGQ